MEQIPIYIVDAFSDVPFGGNPAAVCLLDKEIPDGTKQKIAAEMNLSETAFVEPFEGHQEGFVTGSEFGLRWFTPTTEVPLCGHATLASAAVLYDVIGNKNNLTFHTVHSGKLTADLVQGDVVPSGGATSQGKLGSLIEMRLPLNTPYERVPGAKEAKNGPVMELAKVALDGTGFEVQEMRLSPQTKKLLIRVADRHHADLAKLAPKMADLVAINVADRVRGIIVTVKGSPDEEYDFKSRYFAPWVGIPEDPVTGSAHTVLAPYWAKELDKTSLVARQCSQRGGDLHLRVSHEDMVTFVRGRATVVLSGKLTI